ncbi:hypothetical protein HDU87_001137 [Geranomyces variabilis]|uniref:Uncharacterized protein n=1 Tax=Geranomyces variabilis TaxID=109894 RepID=A0AAD5TNS5_9FUNG|nr:hypothetical protein HDU87_001137 [Geranomyces variabilis]
MDFKTFAKVLSILAPPVILSSSLLLSLFSDLPARFLGLNRVATVASLYPLMLLSWPLTLRMLDAHCASKTKMVVCNTAPADQVAAADASGKFLYAVPMDRVCEYESKLELVSESVRDGE